MRDLFFVFNWLRKELAVDAVCCEPFSPETGKSTGKTLEPTRRVEPILQAESALAIDVGSSSTDGTGKNREFAGQHGCLPQGVRKHDDKRERSYPVPPVAECREDRSRPPHPHQLVLYQAAINSPCVCFRFAVGSCTRVLRTASGKAAAAWGRSIFGVACLLVLIRVLWKAHLVDE
jgi:hypothetical protein